MITVLAKLLARLTHKNITINKNKFSFTVAYCFEISQNHFINNNGEEVFLQEVITNYDRVHAKVQSMIISKNKEFIFKHAGHDNKYQIDCPKACGLCGSEDIKCLSTKTKSKENIMYAKHYVCPSCLADISVSVLCIDKQGIYHFSI